MESKYTERSVWCDRAFIHLNDKADGHMLEMTVQYEVILSEWVISAEEHINQLDFLQRKD